MKIAFHLNCLEQGGAERVVSNLANQFAEDGDEVYILTEWKAENEFRISDKVKRVHVGLKPEDDKKGRITKFLLRIRYLHRFMKQEKPDVVLLDIAMPGVDGIELLPCINGLHWNRRTGNNSSTYGPGRTLRSLG